jgi:hypothetical protein
MGHDSSVGIATRYALDGPAIESRWEARFSRPAMGLTQPTIQWVPFLSRGKAAETWLLPPTPPSVEVTERVELYIYSASVPSWPVLGQTSLTVSIFCTNASSRMINVKRLALDKDEQGF